MRIKDVIKQQDQFGNVRAYVIFEDGYGRESYYVLRNEHEYDYYKNQFKAQKIREEKYKRTYNTPGNNYQPKSNPFIDYKKASNVRFSSRVIAIITAAVLGVCGYIFSKKDPGYSLAEPLTKIGLFNKTKETKFIQDNKNKFGACATALYTGDYSDAPEFDAAFIRDYIAAGYKQNVDDMIQGGKLNGTRFDFNFDDFMTVKDKALYIQKGNNELYESFILSNMGDYTLQEAKKSGTFDKTVDKYLEDPLEFMFQHLNPSDDKFEQLSPYAKIVICEQTKSMLMLEEEGFSFFSHENPKRNSTRDELIEQINEKERSAMYYLDMQITQKRSNNEVEGRRR